MKLGELVEQYRAEHDLSQRQFADVCGLSNGYISMLEKGMNPRTKKPLVPSIPALKKLAAGMALTLSDLMTMAEDFPVTLEDDPEVYLQLVPDTKRLPRLGAIACGTPILADGNTQGYDSVPEWVNADFTLVCKGDSMTGARIMDGDVVCIRQQAEVEQGQIAAVLIGEEATLKRVRYIPGGVALWPENPKYEPLIYAGADAGKVKILGLATHFISKVI